MTLLELILFNVFFPFANEPLIRTILIAFYPYPIALLAKQHSPGFIFRRDCDCKRSWCITPPVFINILVMQNLKWNHGLALLASLLSCKQLNFLFQGLLRNWNNLTGCQLSDFSFFPNSLTSLRIDMTFAFQHPMSLQRPSEMFLRFLQLNSRA